MKFLSAILLGFFVAHAASAAELSQLAVDKSSIGFTSKQMGVPVAGGFRKFDAQIAFDPAKAEAGKVRVDIDLASIDAGSSDATSEARGKDWLNLVAFPKAGFTATSIKSLGGGHYEARGSLTIKGTSRDITVPFTVRNEAAGAWLEGGFAFMRLQFKLGEGTWADTGTVADEIQVKFKFFVSPASSANSTPKK